MASSLRHPHPQPVTGNTQPWHCAGHTLGYQTHGELPDRPFRRPARRRSLTIGRYFAQSPPPPAPPAALGTIPAAMTSPARNPPPPLRDPQANTDLTATGTVAPAPAPPPAPFSLKSSPPVSVHASTVGISSSLVQVGLNKDHPIEVPTNYARFPFRGGEGFLDGPTVCGPVSASAS